MPVMLGDKLQLLLAVPVGLCEKLGVLLGLKLLVLDFEPLPEQDIEELEVLEGLQETEQDKEELLVWVSVFEPDFELEDVREGL